MTKRKNTPEAQPKPRKRRAAPIALVVTAVTAVAAAGIAGVVMTSLPEPAAASQVTVYKSPSCGCCGGWVNHMRANGFSVTVKEMEDLDPVKRVAGISGDLYSCHTAMVDGYVLEGHVPAREVTRLLAERPKARGLAVPGMPAGSPGMNQGPPEPYDVLLFRRDGATRIYARY